VRAVADCRAVLGAELADELGTVPEQAVIDGTRYCHASPVSDMRSFLPEPGDDDEEMLAGASERRVAFGHTHLQFRRSGPGGVELLNPGSVGLPLDGDPRAAYALAFDDGSIELRRVEYDRDVAIGALQERFGDVAWAQRSVTRLQTSRP
jgi:diadenosine tetraphosphatase ApaH/serine/threonine PP2A family protein phosphatase